MDKTHCSYKEVPSPLLFLSPPQLNWRLHSHLFQGLPAITWLLYSRDQFFSFFGLSSLFPPQAIRHISLPIVPEVFCVHLTSSPCQKPLFLSQKLHLLFISLLCHAPLPQPTTDCSTTTPRQWVLGVFPYCWLPCQLSMLLIPPPLFFRWAEFLKKYVNIWKVLEECGKNRARAVWQNISTASPNQS